MNQTEYVNYLVQAINNHNEVIVDLKKLKSFHKEMLWFNAIESHSVYYENIFSAFQKNLDLNSVIHKLLKNTKTPLSFFEHLFSKYPEFIISSYQDSIVDFSLDYFPTLFSKTLLSPLKTTQCLFKLFKNVKDNHEKIDFIMVNQKQNFLPFHPDMYYLMLYFAYTKKNSLAKRRYYCENTKTIQYKPFKITNEFIETSRIIYKHYDTIFDFVKEQMSKNSYIGKSFSNTIVNENDFSYFIEFVSSCLHRDKILEKLNNSLPQTKSKVKKI